MKIQELELKLSLDEVNQILSALGAQSYKDVYALVNKIQQQAQRQLEAQDAAQPAARPSSAE